VRFQCLRHHGIDLGFVADIAMHVQATQFSGQRRAAGIVNIGDHHLGFFAGEAAHAGLADALGSARDDADAAGQAK
jgi:hypothetical protein